MFQVEQSPPLVRAFLLAVFPVQQDSNYSFINDSSASMQSKKTHRVATVGFCLLYLS
jgi:hypothetical protein